MTEISLWSTISLEMVDIAARLHYSDIGDLCPERRGADPVWPLISWHIETVWSLARVAASVWGQL
ncbi:MAG TPA: hypothetical protein VEI04_09155, partial [Syntrophobacteria bacterium]|nr:hypothetical protein [Syntrophobacteria bacterium]